MQIHALRRRQCVPAALAVALTVTTAYAAEFAVTQVILYKHGVAYFEREGSVPAGEEARLDFKTNEMNDVLKSLTVRDANGGRIAGIRYDSNATLEQQLQKYPFELGNQELLSAFLDRIKGSRIELKSGDRSVMGTIMGARSMQVDGEAGQTTTREQVTLLSDAGELENHDLSAFASMRLLDARLESQLKQYLETLARAKSREKRSIYVDSSQHGNRNLHVSYIAPAAIWKSSYRLTLNNPDSVLEGWAIVDNTSDEDWKDVKLSVVSGRPISFVSLLDTPRYGRREVAELPEDRAAGPVVYAGSLQAPPPPSQPIRAMMGSGQGPGYGPGNGGGTGGGVFSVNQRNDGTHLGAGNQPLADTAARSITRAEFQSSNVEGASGATLGELFEYNFAGPVTIKKNQSAMLPFLKDKVAARKLLIYSERDGEHPVNAAEIMNHTAKTLDGGPITVYDGGAYAGEALFETLKTGDKRLIGYAVDYGTRVSTSFGASEKTVREIHAANGILLVRSALVEARVYNVSNVDSQPKTLIVQQEGVHEYSVLSPQPLESTATAYRFEVKVPANGLQLLKVQQERVILEQSVVTDSTPEFLLRIVENKELSARGREQMKRVIDLKRQVAEAKEALDSTKARITELSEDQSRLRQNIDSLNRVKGEEEQVRKYSSQLGANEAQLATLRDRTRDLAGRSSGLETDLRKTIEQLSF